MNLQKKQTSEFRKPFLYTILQREEVLSRAQLDECMEAWADRRREGSVMPFGAAVVSLGYLTVDELAPYLELQRRLAFPPGERKPLGALIIENALLRPSQVSAALQLQAHTGQRLGELLIGEGVLREMQLEVLLRFQTRRLEPEHAAEAIAA